MTEETIKLKYIKDGVYIAKDCELSRFEPDGLPKLKVTEEAKEKVTRLQKSLREAFKGYKPDPVIVTSALLIHAAGLDNVYEVVRQYGEVIFATK